MNKTVTRVSGLAIAFSLFQVGSTTLFLLGAKAKQDAWLAMLIGALAGFVLLIMYLYMHKLDPHRDLYELLCHYWGKWVGSLGGLLFISYFAYEASRSVRDIGELGALTLLNRTPTEVITFIALIVCADVVWFGPRVWFLLCHIFLLLLVFGYGILLLLTPFTGLIHFEFLFPVLENGLTPVVKAAIPEIMSFPFGQTVLFLVLFKIVTDKRKLQRSIVIVYWITAVFLIVMNELTILVLGPEWAASSTYPLFEVTQLIQLPKIVERADVLFSMILFIGIGVKTAGFMFGAVIGLQTITPFRYKPALLLLSIIIYALTFLSPRLTEFLWFGLHVALIQIWPIFQIALPVLLFLTMLIRKKKRRAYS
ncbi:GerAB/ArcD/ProY family transporter [Paenibacillus polymyxa]|uniref:GerAB/ArcD/ProY family transporter n=1 Tax=Paenibacillus polymyxa TaxID=1406 RepID=UPI000C9F17DE|nr:endospore germination permease [Paenibacillus polymyxa]PNQ85239.1 spore gernimation protein [Paenibacillus polymyxa]